MSKKSKGGKSAKQAKAPSKKAKVATGDAITKKARAEIADRIKRLESDETASESPTEQPTKPAREPKVRREPKPKRMSLLDAAAYILASEPKPLGAKDLVKLVTSAGLWTSPGGKTPEATLYAAMTREIAKKGDASRFAKVERGLFIGKAA